MDVQSLRASLAEASVGILEPEGLTFRSMFGGVLAYAEGRPLASLSDQGLALKLDREDQDLLLMVPGSKRLQYEPTDPPSKTYIVVPPEIAAAPELLALWVEKGVRYARSRPLKNKRR